MTETKSIPFSALLVMLRMAEHMSRKDLAAKSGVSYSTVNNLERDTGGHVHYRIIDDLAKALGVDPLWLNIMYVGCKHDTNVIVVIG